MTIGSGLNSLANVIIFFKKSSEVRKLVLRVFPKKLIKSFVKNGNVGPSSGKIFTTTMPANV